MNLNEEQLKSVAAWFAGGASLDEIQKRLAAEFGVHLTYFDLRMIVAELPQPEEKDVKDEGRDKRDPPEGNEPGAPSCAHPEGGEAEESSFSSVEGDGADAQERVPPEAGETPASTLSVTVDALMIPGTMASGNVVFSDGVKGKWYLDQMGRLGLGGDLPQGYRPSPADAALFQARLMEALRAKGLC